MQPPTASRATPFTVSSVACCPVPDFERLIVAGGDGGLSLLAARAASTPASGPAVDLQVLPVSLTQTGPLEALAWGEHAVQGELRLAVVGGDAIVLHKIPQGGSGEATAEALPEPSLARAGRIRRYGAAAIEGGASPMRASAVP